MLEEIINTFKDYIFGIYQIGSSTVPFLKDYANDIDYLILLSDLSKKQEIKDYINSLKDETKSDTHFRIMEPNNNIEYYQWIIHYSITIYGKELKEYEKGILECKNEYLKLMEMHLPAFLDDKRLYHFLAGMYVIKNNSYNFSNEQIENIIKFHNKEYDEKTFKELLDFFNNSNIIEEKIQEENKAKLYQQYYYELENIKKWFRENDWKPNKIITGEWSEDNPKWIEYKNERAIKRARQDELNLLLSK